MVASLRRGALVRALTLLLALPVLAAPAFAQAPTESAWRSVGAAWVEICTAPCRVTNASSHAVRVAVGASAPMVDDAAAAVLTSDNVMREFAVAGLKVYGRALASPARVVVEPLGGASSSGGSAIVGSMEQDVRATGTLNAGTANAAIATPINGQATVGYTFTGLTASGATLTYEQSIDGGTTWTGINAVNRGTGVPEATRATDGQIAISATGRTTIRVRVSTPGTGTITVATNVSVREGIMSLGSPLPPGSNAIGSVLADLRVSGSPVTPGNPMSVQVTNPTATGAVTGPGTAGAQAQAVQGIPGGVPQNTYPCQYLASLPTWPSGTSGYLSCDAQGRQLVTVTNVPTVVPVHSSSTAAGIVPATTTASSLVAKASAGNLYGWHATLGGTAGFIAILNAASAPAAGAAITPIECTPIPTNGSYRARQEIPDRYTTGVVLVATSSCTTFTAVTPQIMAAFVD